MKWRRLLHIAHEKQKSAAKSEGRIPLHACWSKLTVFLFSYKRRPLFFRTNSWEKIEAICRFPSATNDDLAYLPRCLHGCPRSRIHARMHWTRDCPLASRHDHIWYVTHHHKIFFRVICRRVLFFFARENPCGVRGELRVCENPMALLNYWNTMTILTC